MWHCACKMIQLRVWGESAGQTPEKQRPSTKLSMWSVQVTIADTDCLQPGREAILSRCDTLATWCSQVWRTLEVLVKQRGRWRRRWVESRERPETRRRCLLTYGLWRSPVVCDNVLFKKPNKELFLFIWISPILCSYWYSMLTTKTQIPLFDIVHHASLNYTYIRLTFVYNPPFLMQQKWF